MLNAEDTKTLNDYFTRKNFSKEVVDSLFSFCTSIKEACPNAILYTTQTSILFRTKINENGNAFSLTPTKDAYCFSSDCDPEEKINELLRNIRKVGETGFAFPDFTTGKLLYSFSDSYEKMNELLRSIRNEEGNIDIVCNLCHNHPEVTDESVFMRSYIKGIACWQQTLLNEARKKVKDCPQVFTDIDFVEATNDLSNANIAQIMVEMLQNHPNETPAILKEYFEKYSFGENGDPLYVYLLENCPQIVPYFSLGAFICAYHEKIEVIKQIIELGEWNRPYPGYMLEYILECDFSLVDKLDYSGVEGDWNYLVLDYINHYIEEKEVKTDELYSHVAKIASHCPDDSWSECLDKEEAERVQILLNSGN